MKITTTVHPDSGVITMVDEYDPFRGPSEHAVMQVMRTREARIREALIKLGWLPPVETIKVTWSHEAKAVACEVHGPGDIFSAEAGWSRQQHMPLHVWRCRKCGGQSEPAIHADLGL